MNPKDLVLDVLETHNINAKLELVASLQYYNDTWLSCNVRLKKGGKGFIKKKKKKLACNPI